MSDPSLKDNEAVKAIAGSNLHFSKILHQELELEKPGENVIFSPYSVVAVMAMVKPGARANTAEQIKKVLQLPESDGVLHGGFNLVLNALKDQKSDDFTLSTANRIYSMSGFQMQDEFVKIVTDSYNSTIEQVDFANNLEAAAKINSWVESETNKRIQNLISSDALNGMTRLVLVNAIYFKGFWKTKFDSKFTSEGDFFLSENEKIQVPLMHLNNKKFRVGSLENGQKVLSIPYQGDRLSMLIYINSESFTAPSPIEAFKRPSEVLPKLYEESINLILPKFKLETTLSLVKILHKLGLTDMFSIEKADFTGIANGLFVSEVVQKAFIEVNEEGSEAAAATGMVMMLRSLPLPPEDFVINRPFYFQIVDLHTDFVLFQGKCNNPLKST